MLEVDSSQIMRGRVFFVLFALLLCSWSGTPDALEDEVDEASVPTNQQQNWNQPIRPIWQSGCSPQLWQPQPAGMLWEVDFSPDGKLIAAIEEEKPSRIKHDYNFPENAIQFCLNEAKIQSSELDYVVFYEKPFIKFERIIKTVIWSFPKTFNLFQESMKNWLFDKLWIRNVIQNTLDIPKEKIMFSNHHLSHAASAFYCSPFNKAAIVTFDGVGEWATTTFSEGNNNKIKMKKEIKLHPVFLKKQNKKTKLSQSLVQRWKV